MTFINKLAVRILLILLSFLVYLNAPIFAFLNSVPISVSTFGTNVKLLAPELYNYNMEVLSDKYPIGITPAGWVFSILWPLIYFWNFLSAIFMLCALCINPARNPILRSQSLLPNSFFISWMLAFACIVGWLFSFDREIFELSYVFLLTSTVAVCFCLAVSCRAIHKEAAYLKRQHKAWLYMTRILIHNGLGVFVTWISAATFLNLNVVVIYHDSPETLAIERNLISIEASGLIMLGILIVAVIVWFMLENFVFEAQCRFTLSIYPTLLFATSGLYVRNWEPIHGRTIPVVSACLMVISAVALAARTALFIYRYVKRSRQR